MRPSISVCIASYNGEKYIREQILSILPQLEENDEIIISDDNSSDTTLIIIDEFSDHRIKVVQNTGPKGYVSNFENALNHANNDIVFLSDQDDVWMSDKVDVCLKNLKYADLVVHDAIVVDKDKHIISESFYKDRDVKRTLVGNVIKFGFLGCCLAFNRKLLDKALPFPVNHKLCTHDNWIFLIGKTFFDAKVIDNKLIYYRRHSSNTSSGGQKSSSTIAFMIKYRLYLIANLIKRLK